VSELLAAQPALSGRLHDIESLAPKSPEKKEPREIVVGLESDTVTNDKNQYLRPGMFRIGHIGPTLLRKQFLSPESTQVESPIRVLLPIGSHVHMCLGTNCIALVAG
jgi:hypothetical protein